jgi:hypothetical protein
VMVLLFERVVLSRSTRARRFLGLGM